MAIRPDEITSILKQQLDTYRSTLNVSNVGSVLSVGDGIARVHGLDSVQAGVRWMLEQLAPTPVP